MSAVGLLDGDAFVPSRGAGGSRNTIRVVCPECGYKQYDIKASSAKATAAELTCPRCRHTGPVVDG